MIEFYQRKPVHYFTMIDADPIVQWMNDGHVMQAAYDPSEHEIDDVDELERMSRDIEKHYKDNLFSFEHISRMAGMIR